MTEKAKRHVVHKVLRVTPLQILGQPHHCSCVTTKSVKSVFDTCGFRFGQFVCRINH